MKPIVVIPTYNERENVEAMAAAVLANLPPEGQLLFLDDNSPDGTGEVIDAICAREARVHVMHREKKEGLGRAYVAGFAEALRMGATHVIEMDCDFSHDPKDVPRLLAALDADPANPADVVIGSRYVKGGKCVGWPFRRWLISRAGGIFIRVFRLFVPDGDELPDVEGGPEARRNPHHLLRTPRRRLEDHRLHRRRVAEDGLQAEVRRLADW